MLSTEFADLLQRELTPAEARAPLAVVPALETLAEQALAHAELVSPDARLTIEAMIAEIDLKLGQQINLILHHPEFQQMEGVWRGLYFLVASTQTDQMLKIKLLSISKRELTRVLRNFRGTAWDQSPIFKKIYEEEYGQLGGEPYGLLIGDFYFDHSPVDVQLLGDIAQTAAAAHVPFIAGAAPSIMQMQSWAELANPRDLTKIFQTPEYVAWRSLRESEDARYLGLAMPRFLARLPYGARTDPLDAFVFEEDAEGPDSSRFLWANAAYAMAANVTRAFSLYGWCTRIRGVDGGGLVEGLPVYTFPTADGDVDRRCVTEIALSERHEAELARNGLMPLLHLKNTGTAAFFGAQSLQKPEEYEDPAATANAYLSARLPYLFACCRFAHYLKCMVRDKIGRSMSKDELALWLQDWLNRYVDGSPDTSHETWKAAHPLAQAYVDLEADPEKPGQYNAKFLLKPHYQLEGLSVALRLVSRA
ncbi:MAG: type VI secretion system contractile sheath large subunit [Alphaproteobacteria bacterium]|nr:type VI secretion system contractile sheath large subunit [Alphaproteobacteria bacterium]